MQGHHAPGHKQFVAPKMNEAGSFVVPLMREIVGGHARTVFHVDLETDRVTTELTAGLEFMESLRKIRQLVTLNLLDERSISLNLLAKKFNELKVP
jgi:hypothetical protein